MKNLLAFVLFTTMFSCSKPVEPTLSSEVSGTYTITDLNYNNFNYRNGTFSIVQKSDSEVELSTVNLSGASYNVGLTAILSKSDNFIRVGSYGTYKDRLIELSFSKVSGGNTEKWIIKGSKN